MKSSFANTQWNYWTTPFGRNLSKCDPLPSNAISYLPDVNYIEISIEDIYKLFVNLGRCNLKYRLIGHENSIEYQYYLPDPNEFNRFLMELQGLSN